MYVCMYVIYMMPFPTKAQGMLQQNKQKPRRGTTIDNKRKQDKVEMH